MTDLTRHAKVRLQQRAIPPIVVELLTRFGTPVRSARAETFIFDQAARKELRRHLGGERSLKLIEPWLDAYLVIADGGPVITVGRRHKALHRDRSTRQRHASVHNA